MELPGIEPVLKIRVNSGNPEFDDAKVRETTCEDAKGVDGINTRLHWMVGVTELSMPMDLRPHWRLLAQSPAILPGARRRQVALRA